MGRPSSQLQPIPWGAWCLQFISHNYTSLYFSSEMSQNPLYVIDWSLSVLSSEEKAKYWFGLKAAQYWEKFIICLLPDQTHAMNTRLADSNDTNKAASFPGLVGELGPGLAPPALSGSTTTRGGGGLMGPTSLQITAVQMFHRRKVPHFYSPQNTPTAS